MITNLKIPYDDAFSSDDESMDSSMDLLLSYPNADDEIYGSPPLGSSFFTVFNYRGF